jgi:ribosomal protein L24E
VDGDLVWTGNSWARARLVKKGKGQLVDVKLDDGMIFTCDTAHKVLVANRAYPEWRSVISLKPGDILARSLEKAPDGMHIETAEFWYWIGRYYGDGHLTQLARGQVRPTTGKPGKEYRALVDWAFGENKLPAAKKLMKFLKRWGGSPRMEIQRKGKSIVYRVKDRKFNKRMIELGITPNEVAWTKRIADVVFTLSPRFREMFVQGYYDADGTTRKHYKKGWATRAITSVNRELLQDTALILRSLGKRSYINGPYRNRDPHRRPFYRLCTHSDESTLRKVVSVRKRARKEDVYTLMVSDPTHSFDSEGVISKNSGAAGIFKAGMKNLTPIYKDFLKQGYVCWPVLPIHDDLVFEVSEDIVHIWVPLQQDIMEHSVTLKVPIKSDAKVGKIWGDQKKYKW